MSRTRSPAYPAIGLKEAVDKTNDVFKQDYQNPITRADAAKHMGYTGLNGKSLGVLSALIKYGLLEGRGNNTRVSDAAVMIIAHPAGAAERIGALKEAAAKPELFADLDARFQGGKASDQAIRSYLLTQKFIPAAADAAIRSYRETIQLVEEESKGYNGATELLHTQEASTLQPPQSMLGLPVLSLPPGTSIPSAEPYRLSLAGGRLQGTFDLVNPADADEMIRAINAWKVLLKLADEVKKPT